MTIRAATDGHVATVTIANPSTLNALELADLEALAGIWAELEQTIVCGSWW
jgi:enoyl-CoA hydratase/carnithine racemase